MFLLVDLTATPEHRTELVAAMEAPVAWRQAQCRPREGGLGPAGTTLRWTAVALAGTHDCPSFIARQ
tara:strand:+ start:4271 stop:4471 length:201 start_codon:yes stop_codon:yes gene_type:complete